MEDLLSTAYELMVAKTQFLNDRPMHTNTSSYRE